MTTHKPLSLTDYQFSMASARKIRAPKERRLSEIEIKAAILSLPLMRRVKPVVASEFVIGSRIRRADLVTYDKVLTAFEIKSDFDNLNRLSAQATEYIKYFDKVVVVVVTKYIEKTLAMLGEDVEVWEVKSNLEISVRRQSIGLRACDPADLMKLMTKSEKIRYLSNDLPSDSFQGERLRAKKAVIKAFVGRHEFQSQIFWKAIGRRKVQPTQLELLSRFSDSRTKARQQLAKNEQFWRAWHLDSAQFFKLTLDPELDKTKV